MAFEPPTLVTDLDTKKYRTQLNENFIAIQEAFEDLVALLPSSLSDAQAASVTRLEALMEGLPTSSNVTIVEKILKGDGVVGVDSFVPSFNASAFSIAHSSPSGFSAAVINGKYHQTEEAFSKNFADMSLSSGVTTCIFGVSSEGAPLLEMDFVKESLADFGLEVFEVDVYKSGSTYAVVEVRLVADVVIDQDAFDKALRQELPISFSWPGQLPSTEGRLGTGILVPWGCEVLGGYARLETAPEQTDGVEVEFRAGEDTDAENIFTAAASWGPADARVTRTMSALSNKKQLAAGALVYPYLTVAENALTDYPPRAADLSLTVIVRRLYQSIV